MYAIIFTAIVLDVIGHVAVYNLWFRRERALLRMEHMERRLSDKYRRFEQ